MYNQGKMKLKIADKLKKRMHREVALLQDAVINIVYEVFPNAVFHGGTAVWRCYQGSRFSEDIDLYIKRSELIKKERFIERLEQQRLNVKKFKTTNNTIYAKVSSQDDVEMKFEASFIGVRDKEVIIHPYETIDGSFINILTLSPKALIKEKVDTYLSRFLIRDLYDIFILLNLIEEPKWIRKDLQRLITQYKKPKDEGVLKSLVFIGAIPTTEQMLFAIKKWAR